MSAVAEDVLAALRARGWTIATAESLTGGLLVSALIDVPGASTSLRGGIVAYATDLKSTFLEVDAATLAEHGAVHPAVASQMAQGARRAAHADVAIATTGVAGPDPQDGQEVGTVFIAVSTPESTVVERLALTGGRDRIRAVTVVRALELCRSLV